jgi:hypothetical protein
MTESPFVPGLELSRRLYTEIVRPVLERDFPGLAYAAARLGSGSEVLGYDTPMSTDHDWGPTVQLYLPSEQLETGAAIRAAVALALPEQFYGYLVQIAAGAQRPELPRADDGSDPRLHPVWITTVAGFARQQLDWDPAEPLTAAHWLVWPQQQLLQVTAGALFHDSAGELTALRNRLAWYPRDLWLYLLASGWQRISQEEHLMPRAGYVGDELGSALIGARLVHDIMALAFLQEQRYAPYSKWFGTAFGRLAAAPALLPEVGQALAAATWQEREVALTALYQKVAQAQNRLHLAPAQPEAPESFFGRPFRVLFAGRFADALAAQIDDPAIRALARPPLIGSIDQWSDNTDLRCDSTRWAAARHLYSAIG